MEDFITNITKIDVEQKIKSVNKFIKVIDLIEVIADITKFEDSVNEFIIKHQSEEDAKEKKGEKKGVVNTKIKESVKKFIEWTANDNQKQDKYDNTSEPQNISCLFCGSDMIATSKELYDFTNEPLRVIFFFEPATAF